MDHEILIKAVIQQIQTDELSGKVRANAISLLGNLPDLQTLTLPFLRMLALSENSEDRYPAISALSRIDSPGEAETIIAGMVIMIQKQENRIHRAVGDAVRADSQTAMIKIAEALASPTVPSESKWNVLLGISRSLHTPHQLEIWESSKPFLGNPSDALTYAGFCLVEYGLNEGDSNQAERALKTLSQLLHPDWEEAIRKQATSQIGWLCYLFQNKPLAV